MSKPGSADAPAQAAGATTIAVVGGAFSGICLAAHLHRAARSPVRVLVFERSAGGKSVAFGTRNPVHLLNGPAGNHSAFDDAPDHFVDFLARDPAAQRFIDAARPLQGQFVPRMLYWRYLQSIAAMLLQPSPAGARVAFLHAEVRDIARRASGVEVVSADGTAARADFAVLAIGHPAPRSLSELVDPSYLIDDPWDESAVRAIAADAEVTIVGTGQTAIDLVLALAANGHRGCITLVSRRGCIAQPFVPVQRPWTVEPDRIPRRLRPLVRWIRSESSRFMRGGGDWRAVVNALRPHTQRIWYGFSVAEKRRFLEHMAPFWYMHRSRFPPQVVRQLSQLRASGQMRVIAGRITGVVCDAAGVRIAVRPRGKRETLALRADAVINCTGPRWDLERPQNPLIARLIASGAVRWDDVGEGIAVTPEGAALEASGKPAARLFALGPTCRGSLLEVVVARDVRTQCAKLASRLLAEEKAGAPVA